jgi:hypothetical protein
VFDPEEVPGPPDETPPDPGKLEKRPSLKIVK